MGENITTKNLDLLSLPEGAVLRIGPDVQLVVTGSRNPCSQIEKFQKGLIKAVLDKGADGRLVRKTGIMATVKAGGVVRKEDEIEVIYPPLPYRPLKPL